MSSNRFDKPQRTICLVVSTLATPGGAERVAVLLANAWVDRGTRVSIVTTDAPGAQPFFPIRGGVDVRNLGTAGASRHLLQAIVRNVREILTVRAAIRQVAPDVVISFVDTLNVTTVLACTGTGLPVIAAERTSPAYAPIGRVWTILRNLAYRFADRVVVQTSGARDFFPPPLRARMVVIPNPVPQIDTSAARRSGTRVIAIGRFSAEKRFDLLIKSFARVAAKFPQWTLTILGDGPLRPQLAACVEAERMENRVFLPGQTDNAAHELANADIFVLSSAYEGFPNALCEAMAAGAACIATDCAYGPREITRDGRDGILVPEGDAAEIARALETLMTSPAERLRLGASARESMERFSIDRVITLWDEVIEGVRRPNANR